MLGGAAEKCQKETRIAPDPVSDLYMPELRGSAHRYTRGLPILWQVGGPVTDLRLRSEEMNKACTL
jgi:hypothetical protein